MLHLLLSRAWLDDGREQDILAVMSAYLTSVKHSVFVLDVDGKPITPTTPAKARKLLCGGVARKIWSRFGTFGIHLLGPTRREIPLFVLGGDQGTKYEGYSVVGGDENHLNVKLNLPDKKQVVRKIKCRARLRHRRRLRNCRQRSMRRNNRLKAGFLAPSQKVLLNSRLKVVSELFRMYPISVFGYEDVWFDLEEEKRKTDFTSIDVARARFREAVACRGVKFVEFLGTDTKPAREKLGYKKCKNKAADRFEAHCSDSLTMAVLLSTNTYVTPGPTLIVDDTFRADRRQIKETQNGGSVYKIRKGLVVGVPKGRKGVLCGEFQGRYRYCDERGRRQITREICWISTNFVTKVPLAPKK